MKPILKYLLVSLVLALTVVQCAKRGSPTGGPEDTTPPTFVKAEPPNYTTNFEADRIRIYFDEYVKLNNVQKQLIVSPPLERPQISPQGAASKYIEIKISDTLEANTTYVFNFGQSIQDNNEGNPLSFFKYVFSTGPVIDSLTLSGSIKDALLPETDNFVTVMLYEVDSTFTDSTIYKDRPKYVTNTLDSLTSFELTNLKAGSYQLVALKDENGNYTFEPNQDKIAFAKEYIQLPTDSSYTLELFQEAPKLSIERVQFSSVHTAKFLVQGRADSLRLEWLSPKPEGFKSLRYRIPGQDTIQYWFQPKAVLDTVQFLAVAPGLQDTLVGRVRNAPPDSLRFSPVTGGTLNLLKPYEIRPNNPIVQIDTTQIRLVRNDSIPMVFQVYPVMKEALVRFEFERMEKSSYTLLALPGAFTDFVEQTNDTLRYSIRTRSLSDYGDLELTLEGTERYPYLIQLTDEKGVVSQEQWAQSGQTIFKFNALDPGKYLIRLVEDANSNGRYDPGSFLEKRQAEEVIYYPEVIDIRSGWLPKITFRLR
ncbi:Ig-like domain-containing protein [Croceiramulus getboli]|nr:Ig-like domain-containing protein [Flavobacteriaceae bacterium YJPT1-3]